MNAASSMSGIRFWVLREDPTSGHALANVALQPEGACLHNERELQIARHRLRLALPISHHGDEPFGAGFPKPRLSLPKSGFSPDYFNWGVNRFVSRRLRTQLPLSGSIVQYWPIDLLHGSIDARAQEYHLLHIVASQSAIDLTASQCEIGELIVKGSNERIQHVRWYDSMVLLSDIVPEYDIFRVAEDFSTILVTDALAERILRAGCTGIAFLDPATIGNTAYMRRYRTLTSVREEWTGRRADP